MKNYSDVQKVPSARTEADSDMLPIASTSSPTIGNTPVGGSFSSPHSNLNLFTGLAMAALIAWKLIVSKKQ